MEGQLLQRIEQSYALAVEEQVIQSVTAMLIEGTHKDGTHKGGIQKT